MSNIDEALKESESSLLDLPRYYRIWIYGEPGSGKTDLAGRLVSLYDKKACLVSTDSAWITLLKNKDAAGKITKYDFQGFSQVRAIAEGALAGKEPYCNYDTLIWDTVSTSIERVIANLVKVKKFNDQRDPDLASWSHYNLTATALKPTIEALNRAPFNVIYLSHVRQPSDTDKQNQVFAIRPNTPEACFRQVSQEVQMIGWLNREKKGGARVLQVEGTNTVTGKSQIFTVEEGTYPVEQVPELIKQWRQVLESHNNDSFLVEE